MPRHWERRHRRRHSPLDDDWDSDDERAAEVLRHGMTPGGGGGAEPLGHAIEDIDTHSAMELDAVHSNPGSDDAPSAEAAAAATSAPTAPVIPDGPRSLSHWFATRGLPDTHQARRGGDIAMMRAQPDPPDLMLELLLANAELARLRRGMFYDGPLVERRIPPNPVLSSVPSRSSADHVREWRAATGTGSAQALMQQERAAIPGLLYDIGHAQGFGQVGPVAHDPLNLSAISRGANTSMIPPDAAVSGMPGWQVDTRAFVRPHTVVAEWIQQRFIGPDGRVHTFDVDAQRPEVFQTEVRTLRRLAREQMFGERQDSSSSESDQDDADGEDER